MATLPLSFSVRRCEPVLVAPAEPTPHEFKGLSDIDCQTGLRHHISCIWFYHGSPAKAGDTAVDPATIVMHALSKALVYYYPLAGRIRGQPGGGKPVVECTGEGVLFVEADADVRLDQLGDAILPPIPCAEELLHNVEGSDGIFDCPLLLIQVTRLLCGGFAMAVRINHVISDGQSLIQILKAMGQLARGAPRPTPLPVWKRELLDARDPPRVTCTHHEFDEDVPAEPAESVLRSFLFRREDLTALRRRLPEDLRRCSTFDVLTAGLWRCRTNALQLNPEQRVRAMCIVTGRGRFPALVPEGYYGNTFANPTAVCTAGELCRNSLGDAVRLIMKAKSEMTEEYLRSVANLMAVRRWPSFAALAGSVMFSDLRQAGLRNVDLGWGEAAIMTPLDVMDVGTFYVPYTNLKGEDGIEVVLRLPAPAMQRFAMEIESTMKESHDRLVSRCGNPKHRSKI